MKTITVPQSFPLLEQYNFIRSSQPSGTILLLKLGDFYEVLGEDAPAVAKALKITLTHRRGIPMCGIPFHCLDQWSKQLTEVTGRPVATAVHSPLSAF